MVAALGLTDYAEAKIFDYYLHGTAYTQPSTVYFSLFSTAPLDDGTAGTELTNITAPGYGRVAIGFGPYTSRRISNSGTITFTSSSTAWPKAVACGIWDNGTVGAGNLMAVGTLSPQPTVGALSSYSFAASEISIDISFFGPSLAQKFLDKLFKNTSTASLSASLYAALMTTSPDNDGAGGVEVVASGYSRKAATYGVWTAGSAALSSDVTFSSSTAAAYGTVVSVAYYDASTSGNFLWRANLASSVTIGIGANVVLRATTNTVSID
jgi:hypothetical protein